MFSTKCSEDREERECYVQAEMIKQDREIFIYKYFDLEICRFLSANPGGFVTKMLGVCEKI